MKKLILPFVALLIGMAACQKEDTNLLTLEVEHYNGDAKMHIDNRDFAVWDDGDTVWLNETPRRVTVNNTTQQATISVGSIEDDYYASYPYSSKKVRLGFDISLPATQTYRENVQGQQIVAAPMFAYCDYGETTLKFRNVGSVLAVKVLNNTYNTLRVYRISVTADNQNLWGDGRINNLNNDSNFLSSTSLINGGYTVTLKCEDGVEVPAEGKVFYIALPTISGAHLTVTVDDGYGIYTLAQTNNTATFARNTLHQVPFNASENNCRDYLERPIMIKYTATSKLTGFEVGATVWDNTVLSHDYDATLQQGTITFNSEITEIPEYAFYNNGTLLSIELPKSVETIGSNAFKNCGNLASVSMPGVWTVGIMSFESCSALTTLNLPSAYKIETQAFSYCSALTTVNLPNVGWIEVRAFLNCSALTTLNLPRVNVIQNYAFENCSALTTLDLPSVTNIRDAAFSYCSALTTVNLPSVTNIGSNAFENTGIQTITFGPTLNHLGVYVFYDCSNITHIYCKVSQSVPTSKLQLIGEGHYDNCFSYMDCNPILHVLSGMGDDFADDNIWGNAFGHAYGPGTRILEDCPTD